ncbi:MAG TPA: glycosyl hydrolase family 8 [Usitatibacter sp.]|nr:glycosyl hydrolase family 8 [Usitatibacter sp.]
MKTWRLAICFATALLAVASHGADADWETFKQGFVEADGRVVDTGQGRISHSEGQGFAMLFAVHYDDRATFERAWQWTRRNLQVRDDALLAWRWDAQRGVTDRNNASDGDVLAAWALARAGDKWQQPEYTVAARRIARDVRQKAIRRSTHGLVLMPGLEGFDKPEGVTINLSYWVFPALRDLGRIDPAPEWEELAKSGIAILQYSYFGRWKLPPDWLRLGERVAPAGPAPERFGFDAMRIPIYLIWGRVENDALLRPYRDFWGQFEGARVLPAWTNLKDDSIDSHGAGQGVRAIARLVAGYPGTRAGSLPPLEREQGYYSSVLVLLCKVALRERGEP